MEVSDTLSKIKLGSLDEACILSLVNKEVEAGRLPAEALIGLQNRLHPNDDLGCKDCGFWQHQSVECKCDCGHKGAMRLVKADAVVLAGIGKHRFVGLLNELISLISNKSEYSDNVIQTVREQVLARIFPGAIATEKENPNTYNSLAGAVQYALDTGRLPRKPIEGLPGTVNGYLKNTSRA